MYNKFEIFDGFPTISKDPDASLDYTFDWTPFLTRLSDSIASVSYVLTGGLVQTRISNTSTQARSYVSGGTLGTIATITCRITTLAGRVDDRSINLKIEQT